MLDSLATDEARNPKTCLLFPASLHSRAIKKSYVVITRLAVNAVSVGEAVALKQKRVSRTTHFQDEANEGHCHRLSRLCLSFTV